MRKQETAQNDLNFQLYERAARLTVRVTMTCPIDASANTAPQWYRPLRTASDSLFVRHDCLLASRTSECTTSSCSNTACSYMFCFYHRDLMFLITSLLCGSIDTTRTPRSASHDFPRSLVLSHAYDRCRTGLRSADSPFLPFIIRQFTFAVPLVNTCRIFWALSSTAPWA